MFCDNKSVGFCFEINQKNFESLFKLNNLFDRLQFSLTVINPNKFLSHGLFVRKVVFFFVFLQSHVHVFQIRIGIRR